MLERGQKVSLTYYEGENQKILRGLLVEEYDNGLLKVCPRVQVVFKVAHSREEAEEQQRKPQMELESPKTKSMIFNLRSIGFLKVELVE